MHTHPTTHPPNLPPTHPGRIPVLQLCLVRSGLSFTMTVLLMKGMHMSPMFGHRANAPLLVARGACGAVSMAVYYASLQLLPLGDAVTVGGRRAWRVRQRRARGAGLQLHGVGEPSRTATWPA